MGGKYPINTWDEQGSDPKHPGNSRFTINGSSITSGPAQDPRYEGQRFISVQGPSGKYSGVVDDDDDSYETDDDADYAGSSGCFIATATLQDNYPADILVPLKKWRYDVLETTFFGNILSKRYRNTAPRVAAKMQRLPRVCAFLRKYFVFPAIDLAEQAPSTSRNMKLLLLFLVGSVIATTTAKLSR